MSVNYGSLRNRYDKYVENGGVDDSFGDGPDRKQVLDLSGVEGVKFWKPEVGTHAVDIIPYKVTSNKHPHKIKAGGIDYVLDVWVHRFVGPNKDNFLCAEKMGKGRCPICEEFRDKFDDVLAEKKDDISDDKEAYKAAKKELSHLLPKQRVYYNLIDLDDLEAGIQIYEAPWFWFEKTLVNNFAAKKSRKPSTPYFWQHDEGLTILVSSTQDSHNGREFVKSLPTSFEDREVQYEEDIIDQAYSLDSLLVIPSYEEVEASLQGIVLDEEEEATEEAPKEAEAPKPKPKRTIGKPATKVAPEESSGDEEMSPAEARKARMAKLKKNKTPEKPTKTCPVEGGVFGDDYCGFDECESCDLVEECEEASEN